MKIAVFHNLPGGGAKRVLFEEVKYLSRQNSLDLFELSSTDERYMNIKPFFNKVFNYKFSKPTKGFFLRFRNDFDDFIKLRNVHKKIARDIDKGVYDFVLVHADMYTQAPFLLRYLNTPSIYFSQESLRIVYEKEFGFNEKVPIQNRLYESLIRKIRKNIDRKNIKSASLVLVNSKFSRANISKAYGIKPILCYLGVDLSIFKKRTKKRKNQVLFIGDPVTINGFDLVSSAIALVPNNIKPKIKIIQAGKMMLTDRELAFEYSTSLVTICASINEPFGFAPLESMACSTPVIAVNEGGYRESVINNKTGFLLKRDKKELTKKLTLLIKNRKTLERFGVASRAHVEKNWTWTRHYKELDKNILKLILK